MGQCQQIKRKHFGLTGLENASIFLVQSCLRPFFPTIIRVYVINDNSYFHPNINNDLLPLTALFNFKFELHSLIW